MNKFILLVASILFANNSFAQITPASAVQAPTTTKKTIVYQIKTTKKETPLVTCNRLFHVLAQNIAAVTTVDFDHPSLNEILEKDPNSNNINENGNYFAKFFKTLNPDLFDRDKREVFFGLSNALQTAKSVGEISTYIIKAESILKPGVLSEKWYKTDRALWLVEFGKIK